MEGRYDYTKACDHLKAKGLYVDRGYTYGSAWLCEIMPDEIIAEIKALFEITD